MGRKGRKGQGPQREPLAERLAKIKSKEGKEAFIEMKKQREVLKAKEDEFELDLSSLVEALQTPPAKGRRQHSDGADQRHDELGPEDYRWYAWSWVRHSAWPRRRRRHP